MALAIASSNTYSDNSGTVANHPVNLPTGISAGNLLLMYFIANSTPTVTTPSGWSLLASGATPGTYDTIRLYGKIASGSEGATETVALSANNRASAITYCVTGNRNGVTSSEIAVSAVNEQGNGINHDPPSLTPSWGSEENLWFAIAFCQDGAVTWSAYPANYSLGQNAVNTSSGNGNAVAAAARLLTAASEDPGAFTTVTNRQRSSFTLAVRPLAAAAVNADLAVTEEDDTVSASSTVLIQGTLSATELDDVATAAGTLQVTASAFITEADDTAASTATVALSGSLAVTEGDDVPSASGTVDIVGSLVAIEADDTLSVQGVLGIEAVLIVTEGDDTLSAEALMPIVYPRRGGIDEQEQEERERRKRRWKDDLGRIIDRSFRVANGEIDPVTFEPIPPPDYSAVIDELKRQALILDEARTAAFVAEQERLQEEEAIAVLLLAA